MVLTYHINVEWTYGFSFLLAIEIGFWINAQAYALRKIHTDFAELSMTPEDEVAQMPNQIIYLNHLIEGLSLENDTW